MAEQKQRSEFADSFIETLKGNGTLLTTAAVTLIVISGVSIVDSRNNWWVTALAVLGFFVTTFLFMNARVVIKSTLVTFVILFLSASAFQIGVALDATGMAGLLWMGQILFMFFALLSYSYVANSGRSRWGLLATSQFLAFFVTYILLIAQLNSTISVIAGLLSGSLFFVFFYKFFGKAKVKASKAPTNKLTNEFVEEIIQGFEKSGWDATALPDKGEGGGVLVWNDRAYFLYPVIMDEPFGVMGRKHPKLAYHRKNITPWLLSVAFNRIPLWRARGADITLVLVDLKRMNGKETKVIGAGMPDTNRKLPVGVIPSPHSLTVKSSIPTIIQEIETNMKDFKRNLTDKQKLALLRIGRTSETAENVSDKEDVSDQSA